MVTTACAICHTKDNFAILFEQNFTMPQVNTAIFSARRLPDRIHYRIVRCKTCGLLRSNPILAPKKITELYKKSTVTYTKESHFLGKTYRKYLQDALHYCANKKTLLEIGCGNGFFLEEAKKLGFSNVYGVEPGKDAVKQASKTIQKNITIAMFERKITKKNFFDMICCFHTFDHVIDPNAFLQDIAFSLREKGVAFFIVHNSDAVPAKIMGQNCPIYDIEHIYLFNKKTLKTIFEKNGYIVEKLFDITNTYPVEYIITMAIASKKMRGILLSVLRTLHCNTLPISLPLGNIGVFARKMHNSSNIK